MAPGAGAVIALAHDVIITLGVLSLFHIEIDLTIVASLMSVIGYSLNDSIVVSDRIRENFRKIRRGTPYEIMNVSLTQTLSRTLMTSGTTLMVVLMLYIFGGAMLQGFSLAMLIGVSIGTVSSIYVASALALKLGMKREHMLQQKWKKRAPISLRFCLNRRSIQRNEKERRWALLFASVSARLHHRRLGGRNQAVQTDVAQLFRRQATEAQLEVLAGFRQQRVGAGDRLRQRLGGQRRRWFHPVGSHSTTALNGGSAACERMRTCSCACVPLASLLMWLSETLSSPMPLCKRAALRATGSR